MKKVSEIAKELGVTPQAVYKRINKTFKQQLTSHVHKDEHGKILVDTGGIAIIRKSFDTIESEPFKQPFTDGSQERLQEMILKQIDEKDHQISELMKQNESLINKLEIMQVLLRNEQERGQLLIEEKKDKEPTGIRRWFKKSNAESI